MFPHIGKLLIILGISIVVVGIVLLFADKIPYLGRLPGDITFTSGNTQFYFPIVTCLILSVLITLVWNLISRWK